MPCGEKNIISKTPNHCAIQEELDSLGTLRERHLMVEKCGNTACESYDPEAGAQYVESGGTYDNMLEKTDWDKEPNKKILDHLMKEL